LLYSNVYSCIIFLSGSIGILTLSLHDALPFCLGFLRSNFHPARLFLGDTGAMFAGFALGAISVEGAVKGAATVALSIPLLALGLDRKSTRLNSSHVKISYAVFRFKKKKDKDLI